MMINKNCIICQKTFGILRGNKKCCSKECSKINNKKVSKIFSTTYDKLLSVMKQKRLYSSNYRKTPRGELQHIKLKIERNKSDSPYKKYQENYRNSINGQIVIKKHRNNPINKLKKRKYDNTSQGKIQKKNYKVKRRDVMGKHSLEEWDSLNLLLVEHCLSCWKSGVKLTEDHIIPLCPRKSLPSYMKGDNTIYNIQPLCKSCNSHKYNKYKVPNINKLCLERSKEN